MHLAAVSSLLAVVATVVVNAGAVPQLAEAVRRRGDCDGVSVTAGAMIVVSCTGWLVYSLAAGLVVSAVSSALGLAIWAVICALVLSRRGVRELAAPAAFAAALVGGGLVWGTAGLGAVLVADAVLTTVPQLTRLRHGAEGVAALTWASMAAAAACWLVYGIGQGDMVMVASQAVRALVATAIVVVACVTRRGAPGLEAAPASRGVPG